MSSYQPELSPTHRTGGGKIPVDLREWKRLLFQPVDGASLAVFRILLGSILLWEVYRYFHNDWIRAYYMEPPLLFKYYLFEWVRPWPGNGMLVHFGLLGVCAALVTVGLFYRAAAIVFFLGFTYVFLLDQARYLNHFYLVSLLTFILCFTDANRCWSVDGLLKRRRLPETVPYWNYFLLRGQLFLVYVYGGIAKLNEDWLFRAEPISTWLRENEKLPAVLKFLQQPWAGWFVAYSGLLFDLGIGFLLIYRRTRLLGLALCLVFHVTNNYLFTIGIFPYFAMAASFLFLDPDWPRQLKRWVLQEPPPLPADPAGFPPSVTPAQPMWVLPFVAAFLLIQALVPLRHWLYPGNVVWNEAGHRFSWRMKLRDKDSLIAVTVVDPDTGREHPIDPAVNLPEWQIEEMMGRPDMILQYAHFLRDAGPEVGVRNPQVYVSVLCSVNGRPQKELIKQGVDLAKEPRRAEHFHWVTEGPPALDAVPDTPPDEAGVEPSRSSPPGPGGAGG